MMMMKLINFLVSLSCAFAAVLPILNRQLSVEFNRITKRINYNPSKIPNTPRIIKLFSQSISYCEAPKTVINDVLYDDILARKNQYGLIAALENDSINYNYIPNSSDFYNFLLEIDPSIGYEIMKRYFDSGTFEKMRQSGHINYRSIMESSIRNNNYKVALLALNHSLPIIKLGKDSGVFEESTWLINPDYFDKFGSKHLDQFEEWKFLFWFLTVSENDVAMLDFYSKYKANFPNSNVDHWKLGTIKDRVIGPN